MKRITIELTNVCNLECKPCPRHHIKMPAGFMTEDLWIKLIDQIVTGTTIIPFWRGEPLLHPFINSMLSHAINKGMKILLATNGYFLPKGILKPEIIGMFEAISVSMHGPRSVEGYRWLQQNVGSHLVNIQATLVDGEGYEPPDDIPLRMYHQHTLKGVWGCTDEKHISDQYWCKRLSTDLVVTWDGKISRCCYVWQPESGLDANIMTLKEIWESCQMEAIRLSYPDKTCSGCDQWQGKGTSL